MSLVEDEGDASVTHEEGGANKSKKADQIEDEKVGCSRERQSDWDGKTQNITARRVRRSHYFKVPNDGKNISRLEEHWCDDSSNTETGSAPQLFLENGALLCFSGKFEKQFTTYRRRAKQIQ